MPAWRSWSRWRPCGGSTWRGPTSATRDSRTGTLTGLTGLLLNYTRITDAAMPQLEKLEQLQELGLIRTRVTDKSMPIVGRFTQLADLNLDYTDVGDKGLEALGGLTKLQRLSLDSTNVTDASARAAGGVPAAPQAEPLPHVLHRKGLPSRSATAVPAVRDHLRPQVERPQTPPELIGPTGTAD